MPDARRPTKLSRTHLLQRVGAIVARADQRQRLKLRSIPWRLLWRRRPVPAVARGVEAETQFAAANRKVLWVRVKCDRPVTHADRDGGGLQIIHMRPLEPRDARLRPLRRWTRRQPRSSRRRLRMRRRIRRRLGRNLLPGWRETQADWLGSPPSSVAKMCIDLHVHLRHV